MSFKRLESGLLVPEFNIAVPKIVPGGHNLNQMLQSRAPRRRFAPLATAAAGISDDFSGDLSKWTQEVGSWTINSGAVRNDTSGTHAILRYTAAPTSTSDQYARITLTTLGDEQSGVAMRVGATGNCYGMMWNSFDFKWIVMDDAGNWVETVQSNFEKTWVNGDVLGVTVSGTGDGTTVEFWANPDAGDTPADWGAVDQTFTNNPSNPVNTGTSVGLHVVYTTTKSVLDDFVGGDK